MEIPYTIVTPFRLGMSGLGLQYKYNLPTIRSGSWSQMWRDIKIREVEILTARDIWNDLQHLRQNWIGQEQPDNMRE